MDLATDDFKVSGALRTLEWRKKTQTIILFQTSPVQSCVNIRHADCRRCLVDRSAGRFIQHVLEGVFFIGGCRVDLIWKIRWFSPSRSYGYNFFFNFLPFTNYYYYLDFSIFLFLLFMLCGFVGLFFFK